MFQLEVTCLPLKGSISRTDIFSSANDDYIEPDFMTTCHDGPKWETNWGIDQLEGEFLSEFARIQNRRIN